MSFTFSSFARRIGGGLAVLLVGSAALFAAGCEEEHDHTSHRPGGASGGHGGGSACDMPIVFPTYEVTAIDARALDAINTSGQAAGHDEGNSGDSWTELFLPSPAYGLASGSHALDLGANLRSRAYGINDHGVVVGSLGPLDGSWSTAFSWSPTEGKRELLPLAGHQESIANAVNGKGDVVGQSFVSANGKLVKRSVLWRGGEVIDLGDILGSDYLSANAVTDPADAPDAIAVAGSASTSDFTNLHAYLWLGKARGGLDAGMHDLGASVPGAKTQALGINNGLDVVGSLDGKAALHHTLPTECRPAGWHDLHAGLTGQGIPIDTSESSALGINESGVVVGLVSWKVPDTPEVRLEAAVWIHGHGRLLRDLVSNGEAWKLSSANAINDAGQIVGWGIHDGDQAGRAFLLTPK